MISATTDAALKISRNYYRFGIFASGQDAYFIKLRQLYRHADSAVDLPLWPDRRPRHERAIDDGALLALAGCRELSPTVIAAAGTYIRHGHCARLTGRSMAMPPAATTRPGLPLGIAYAAKTLFR